MGDARRCVADPGAHVLVLTWLGGLLRRRTGRMIGQSAGVALAVLLLAALGTFFTASRAALTPQPARAAPPACQRPRAPGSTLPPALAPGGPARGDPAAPPGGGPGA